MDARDQRALTIAATCKIDRKGGEWLVPSQSTGDRKYKVKLDGEGTCNCPDCLEGGFVCKHIRAVRMVLKRELGIDGTVTETKQVLFEEKRVYSQDWQAYNRAQACEKHRFQVLLHDLCKGLPETRPNSLGRKPHRVRDAVFAMVYKVYTTFSSRRFACDLVDAHERGYLSKKIPGMKITHFMECRMFTPMLHQLIEASAAPLRAVETKFAVDSSGFSSSKFERWYDMKYGVTKQKCVWVKAHIACGTKTNVITAVRILGPHASDTTQFAPLVDKTAETFAIQEVSADKAYASNENFEAVANHGGTAFLAFKENATGSVGGLFAKMLHYFKFRQDEFMARYHQRSNVESAFSMCKRKFGDAVRSRTDTAMVNEVLCKFLCHNLCCLIQEQHELGIEPVFWTDKKKEAATTDETPVLCS